MPNLFEVTDPRGWIVVCTEERWRTHVLRERPWMLGWHELARAAIEAPSIGIYQDAQFANRHVYYRLGTPRTRYLKVVVEFDGTAGSLVTAIPTNNPKDGEHLIWPGLSR